MAALTPDERWVILADREAFLANQNTTAHIQDQC